MSNPTILVVDDEEDLLELLKYDLTREGFKVVCASTGEQALVMARSEIPDLILLDLMLPGLDGLQVTRRLKEDSETRDIPIAMLTARGEEADIVTGLELGAEDYITKPFSKRVLAARLKTLLRRKRAEPADGEAPLTIRDLTIHPGRHEVLVKGARVQLTFTEFGILHFLARRPGWVFTRTQIVDAVRGEDYFVTDRAIDVQIVGLRKKLGMAAAYIETVRGVGYRFKE
ncbi:MAG: DNA-binding response regulator [Deltaproteobacteria bacterium HGW-Deltaproteobacteria-15]|jgi:two-component system phosphate regulon response regulator PhoB|nr:MAG: DNA-binding response regulator [Deltaproteobacteria bacterium HGW-Deltaproteobacteria-15]